MRIKLKPLKQRELIKNFKNSNDYTWDQLAQKLNIKKGKLLGYYYEKSLIDEVNYYMLDPHKKYTSFIVAKLDENWGMSKGGKISKGNTKKINFPSYSKEFAEFYGIMLGDGNATNLKDHKVGTYMIRIVGHNDLDRNYLIEYVKPLIEKLFSIEVKEGNFKETNTMFIQAHSVQLIKFLEAQGFKSGDKIRNKLEIPKWIKENEDYLRVCLRGLIDTDGSIYKLTNQNSYQINFKNYNSALLEDFREGLISLGINCSKISKGNSVYITKKSEIAKFFKLVGFRNAKHLNRIKEFKIAL